MIATSSTLILALLCIGRVAADDPPKPIEKPEQSAPATQESEPDQKPKSVRTLAPDDDKLLKALEKQSAPEEDDENPLLRIGQNMRDVQDRLGKSDPGDETQTLQQGIVQDIDTLIEQLKKAGGESSKSTKQKRNTSTQAGQKKQQGEPNKASEPSEGQEVARPGQLSDAQLKANERLVRAVWGHLPEKLREEMQQAFKEADLPKYRPMIEQYFKAIAEQKEPRR